MASRLKILWITPKWTLPATDGARIATERLISNTIKAGAIVDYICISPKGEERDVMAMARKWKTNDIKIIERFAPKNKIGKLVYYGINLCFNPFIPLTLSSFAKSRIKNDIQNYIKDEEYDYLLLDGLHLGTVFFKSGKLVKPEKIKRIVYRSHNVESDLWIKAAKEENNIISKLILSWQSKQMMKVEKEIISSSDIIAAISEEDLKDTQKMVPNSHVYHVPLGLNFNNPLPKANNSGVKLLFVGRLDWPPNRDGLEWLLKSVWSKVIAQRDDIELTIVGSGNKSWLNKYKNTPKINFIGFVDDIKSVYQECDFCIVPMRYGSGTRIKVLETFAMGRPLISSSMGIQGAGLQENDFVSAETENDWVETLINIKIDASINERVESARKKLIVKYDEVQVGANFYNLLVSSL